MNVPGAIVNTQTMEICAHPVKVQGADDFVLPDVFQEGSKPIEIKSHRNLRGLMAHWAKASLYWRTCLRPIGAFLAHGDEAGIVANCADRDIAKAFGSMLQMLRHVAHDAETLAYPLQERHTSCGRSA